MTSADRHALRSQLQAAAPGLKVRFHGAPRNAPSIPHHGVGYIAFRSWGREYVTIWPAKPLDTAEANALDTARRPWDADNGLSIMTGSDGWPFAEETQP